MLMSYATKDQQLLLNEYASVGIEFSTPWNPVPPGLQIDCRFREDRAEQFLAWAGLLIKGQATVELNDNTSQLKSHHWETSILNIFIFSNTIVSITASEHTRRHGFQN
jgi:hypothetical protein